MRPTQLSVSARLFHCCGCKLCSLTWAQSWLPAFSPSMIEINLSRFPRAARRRFSPTLLASSEELTELGKPYNVLLICRCDSGTGSFGRVRLGKHKSTQKVSEVDRLCFLVAHYECTCMFVSGNVRRPSKREEIASNFGPYSCNDCLSFCGVALSYQATGGGRSPKNVPSA